MTGDFNQSYHMIREIIAMWSMPNDPTRQQYNVEWIHWHSSEAPPEIVLVLIKYRCIPGFTFTEGAKLDLSRAGEMASTSLEVMLIVH